MPAFPHDDIESAINTALKTILTAELQTALPASDALRLRTLKMAPLQDDPTTSAPFVVYGPSWELQSGYSDEDLAEVGGNILYSTPYKAICGTPIRKTREDAYSAITDLSNRVRRTILRHYTLANINAPGRLQSADGGQYIDAIDPSRMWLGSRRRIYGGDNEFYGEAIMFWRYNYFQIPDWTSPE